MMMLLMIAALLVLTGCATTVDDTSHATPKGEGWLIKVSGVRTDEVWESNFDKWKKMEASGYAEHQFKRKGKMMTVMAVPLVKIAAIIDDADGTMPYSFKKDLWESGYDLSMAAADGYTATINTAEYKTDELYIADMLNGEKIAPMVCGNVSGKLWVRELAEITASLEPVSLTNNDFELVFEVGDKAGSFLIGDLEKMDCYIEDNGSFTNSHNNTFAHKWGGVKIVDMINNYTELTPDMSVTIEAMDGYAMTYSGKQLLDNSDGDWILAFKEDGEYMPEDPGYIRLVKVGPKKPNFTGHVSARMVKKIIIKDVPFKDFDLEIITPAGTEVMDAQTLMSGVTNSRTVVEMWNKKKKELKSYMGMPIYMLLEKYKGTYSKVNIVATDGFKISLSASELEGNDDVIIAMFKGDGSDLSDKDFPLVVAWDKNAAQIPAGIKKVRNIEKIILE